MPLKDVVVTINVANPAPRIGLGRPVIFTQAAGEPKYTEFSNIGALREVYPIGTTTEAKAGTVFAQTNQPDKVAVATYDTDVEDSLELFYNNAWHFALIANDDSDQQVQAASFMNDKDFKFVAVQVKDDAGREAVKGKKRTLIFDHDIVGEHLDAAAVGENGSLPVGSITWKFKSLKKVTPRYLSDVQMAAIDEDNSMAYVYKGTGKAQLSNGVLADGEWIDVVHGQDWVKADMENEVQYALEQNAKLPYDSRGIAVITAAAETTLKRAFNNDIIALLDDGSPDYTVSALTRDQVEATDRKERVYRGLSFEFGNAGAIHSVRIKGQINI